MDEIPAGHTAAAGVERIAASHAGASGEQAQRRDTAKTGSASLADCALSARLKLHRGTLPSAGGIEWNALAPLIKVDMVLLVGAGRRRRVRREVEGLEIGWPATRSVKLR
jgi:hypothetical protein